MRVHAKERKRTRAAASCTQTSTAASAPTLLESLHTIVNSVVSTVDRTEQTQSWFRLCFHLTVLRAMLSLRVKCCVKVIQRVFKGFGGR